MKKIQTTLPQFILRSLIQKKEEKNDNFKMSHPIEKQMYSLCEIDTRIPFHKESYDKIIVSQYHELLVKRLKFITE